MEIIRTGDLQRIKYTNTEDVKTIKLFQGIYGVGEDLISLPLRELSTFNVPVS